MDNPRNCEEPFFFEMLVGHIRPWHTVMVQCLDCGYTARVSKETLAKIPEDEQIRRLHRWLPCPKCKSKGWRGYGKRAAENRLIWLERGERTPPQVSET